jgi:hypothetical protein
MQAAIEAGAIGLLLGLIDIHSTSEDFYNSGITYATAGLFLGLRHGRRAWQAWIPLSVTLYLAHRAAIALGYKPPYVEVDAATALACLRASWPAGLGLCVGAFVRLVTRVGHVLRLPAAPAERPSARRYTVRRMMFVVAAIALHLAFLRMLLLNDPFFGFGTNYAADYNESRFSTLRAGMSCQEVEATVGSPLRKVPWDVDTGPRHQEMWFYSYGRDDTSNYWRRWVLVEQEKVVEVISDFWFD